jgi:O-antigen ligase
VNSSRIARTRLGKAPVLGLSCTVLCLLLIYFRPVLEYFISGQVFLTTEVPQTLYIVTITLAMLGFLVTSTVTHLRSLRHGLVFLLAIMGVTCLSGVIAKSSLAEAMPVLHSLVGTWMTFVIFRFACETRRGSVAISAVLAGCAAVNSMVGLWGVATKRTLFNASADLVGTGSFGYDAVTGRSGGIAGENYVGMYDVPALIAGLFLMRHRRWRPAGIALSALSSAAIIVSLSRGSILSALTAAMLFIWLTMKRSRSAPWLLVLLLAAVYAGAGYIGDQDNAPAGMPLANSTGYRFAAEGLTNESRLAIWRKYFDDVITDNPVFGMGGGYIQFQALMDRRVPHNSFLDILVEYGSVGLLLYLGAFAAIVAAWVRCRGRSPSVLPDLLFCCFCGMTVSIVTLSNPLARPLWAVAGAIVGVRRWIGAAPASPLFRPKCASVPPPGWEQAARLPAAGQRPGLFAPSSR